jgi:hypothetical protein
MEERDHLEDVAIDVRIIVRRFFTNSMGVRVRVKVRVRVRVRVKVTLLLAVYRQSVCLGDKPLETHDQ